MKRAPIEFLHDPDDRIINMCGSRSTINSLGGNVVPQGGTRRRMWKAHFGILSRAASRGRKTG